MKVGDYVTIQEIKDQSEARWVVLTDLDYRDFGDYEDVEGGIIRHIDDSNGKAWDAWSKFNSEENPSLLIRGAIESLSVGGVVFVE
ncbi:MAG: hypothetical protein FWF77_03850 [Defluviitaleaceae bacterium]|nr:hypothetical protein [Defluviitaleaceae bacterium]